MRRLHLVAIALALGSGALPPAGAYAQDLPPGTRVDTIARGLDNPWSVAFLPDGRLLVSERRGTIVAITPDGRSREWLRLDVARGGPGLLGMAASPRFADDGLLWVVGGFARAGADSGFENRLLLLADSAGSGRVRRVLLDGLPSARAHAGAAVAFGPDGKLWVTLGDAFRPETAQDPRSPGGKLLRLERDGSAASGNPVRGSRVYASGLRNTQGLAWEPATGALFATEHGPSGWPWEGGRREQDELNVIVPGGNYGWPTVSAKAGDARFIDPIADWTPAIAPSGLAFYTGPYAPWRGHLLIGAMRGQHIRRLELRRQRGRWEVVAEHEVARGRFGRVRGVFMSPDGRLFVTTSSRRTGDDPDDLVLRITLPASATTR